MDKNVSINTVFFDLGYTLMYFDTNFGQKTSESYLVLAKSLIHQGFALDAIRFAERFETVITQYYHDREIDLIEKPVEGFVYQVMSEFGQDNLSRERCRLALNEMYKVTENHWKLEEDTLDTLETLRSRGFRLGIISNAADAHDVRVLIEQHHLQPFFEMVLSSSDIGFRKPDPRIFAVALAKMGVQSQRAVQIGDTLGADILGAHRSGMRGIWIKRRSENPRNALMRNSVIPDAEIDRLAELPAVLDAWNR